MTLCLIQHHALGGLLLLPDCFDSAGWPKRVYETSAVVMRSRMMSMGMPSVVYAREKFQHCFLHLHGPQRTTSRLERTQKRTLLTSMARLRRLKEHGGGV